MKILFLNILLLISSFSFAGDKVRDLTGNYFGRVKYDGDKRTVTMLMNKIEGENAYYAVVTENLSPFQEKGFIKAFFKPGEKNGYLKELYQWIRVVKMVANDDNTMTAYKLRVEEGKILTTKEVDGTLELSKRGKAKGSRYLTKVQGKDVELKFRKVWFPHYKFPLKSSWERSYIPGPYNPGYKQADIDVLELKRDFNAETKDATAIFNVEELKDKPLLIKGEFTVKEDQPGMFTFVDRGTTATLGADLVEDKIGVFVDVYNFQPIMNTVELILVDPANPYGSQMYFEEFGNPDKKK